MAKKPNHRKKAVVNPRVQWTLALRVVLHFFLFVCAGAVFGLINQFIANPLGGLEDNLMSFCRNCGPMLLALLCLMPIFIRDTLTLSNRIAGPIHNMKNKIRQLADGETDVPPLKFRKGDMWGDMPELFNRMVNRLHTSPAEVPAERETSDEPELVEV